jgi:hypothetical protein
MVKTMNNISRRSFLTSTAFSIGAVAFGSTLPLIKTGGVPKNPTGKTLLATTDYVDNILVNKSFMDRGQLDDLHKYLARLGITRHQWIVDTIGTEYDNNPDGFDPLAEAAEFAHKHGLEFYAEIKPFEGGGFGIILPHTMPFPKGTPAFKDIRGIFPLARVFAAENLHMNLKRRPGTFEFTGPVTAIRLVKSDDLPTRVKDEHLSIWSSPTNNRFEPYNGPVSFRETVEWRYHFPKWRLCRILHLEGLLLPDEHVYILVKCSLTGSGADFSNEAGSILEISGPDEKIIPYTMSTGPVGLDLHNERYYQSRLQTTLIRYLQMPEVQAEIQDPQKMQEHYRDFYGFTTYRDRITDTKTLDSDGFIAAACGKPEYMLGNLHPIYPEVREHWLELVRYCLERNVDGINFRVGNHTYSSEYWDYGFNEPVLEASQGKTDYPTVSRINGDAYTRFLRQARDLVKKHNKGLMHHLHVLLINPDDRERNPMISLLPNFEWQWKTWVREIGDEFHFRGSWTLRPWNLNKALDAFSASAKAVNKPIYFQSDFHGMKNNEGRRQSRLNEIELVKKHPGLSGYILYTSNNYTIMNEDDKIEVLPFMKSALRSYYK